MLAAIGVLTGLMAVSKANRRLDAGLKRLHASPLLLLDTNPVAGALSRLGHDVDAAKQLLDRAASALREIADGFRNLRLREAMAALRVAGIAVRALLALR
ncbi:MAG: hypothetical protein ABI231_10380 [Candidatus Tumulicola sp.]